MSLEAMPWKASQILLTIALIVSLVRRGERTRRMERHVNPTRVSSYEGLNGGVRVTHLLSLYFHSSSTTAKLKDRAPDKNQTKSG